MKELLHMRVFDLDDARYKLPYGGPTIEEYYMQELQEGYVITRIQNFGIEKLQVTSYYSPEAAEAQLEGKSVVSNLTEAPKEEV